MAVPTIATVSPNAGNPTGGQLIEITGTNFQIPAAAPASGPVPAAAPTVEVLFGGVASPRVAVVSATRLYVVVPKQKMPVVSGATQGTYLVDVEVRNIDSSGVLIPGETVTSADAYTYNRPDISTSSEAPLTNLIRQLLQTLKSEVIPNVSFSVHTDYDSATATAAVDDATAPGIVLIGPSLTRNTLYTDNAPTEIEVALGEYGRGRRPIHFDIGFDIIVIAKYDMHLVNLISLITTVLDRNSAFQFVCPDPIGTIQFDLEWTDGLSVSKQTNQLNSNIRAARGSFQIVGFPFDVIEGTTQDAIQDIAAELTNAVTLQAAEQIGENLPANWGSSVRSPPPPRNT